MSKFTRRAALKAGAVILAAPAIVQQANAQSAFGWRRFAGERIEVSLTKSPRSDILERHQREFEDLIRPAFAQDEWILITVGAVFGFVMGEVQALLLEHFARR